MESKNLHQHTLPIVALAAAGMIAIVGLVLFVGHNQLSGSDVASSLTTQTFSVTTTSPVTAQIHSSQGVDSSKLPDLQALNRDISLNMAIQVPESD